MYTYMSSFKMHDTHDSCWYDCWPKCALDSRDSCWQRQSRVLQSWKGHLMIQSTCGLMPANQVLAAGLFSGVCIAATLHPLFVVKTHQQVICEETEGLVLCWPFQVLIIETWCQHEDCTRSLTTAKDRTSVDLQVIHGDSHHVVIPLWGFQHFCQLWPWRDGWGESFVDFGGHKAPLARWRPSRCLGHLIEDALPGCYLTQKPLFCVLNI